MSHVLLWSQRDNAMRVLPVEVMLSTNRRAYGDDKPVEYVPIAMGVEGDMYAAAQAVRCTLASRGKRRHVLPEAA